MTPPWNKSLKYEKFPSPRVLAYFSDKNVYENFKNGAYKKPLSCIFKGERHRKKDKQTEEVRQAEKERETHS